MSASSSDLPPPLNRVFVDFENVQQIDFPVMGSKAVHLTILVGAKQPRMDVALVEQLVNHPNQVDLVRLTSSGKDALDLALAYYVGQAAAVDPTSNFHIVSRDAGFDPLIEHLRTRRIRVQRHDDFRTLTFSAVRKAPSTLPELPLDRAIDHLKRNPNNRPKRRKTLVSYLSSLFGKSSTGTDAQAVVEELAKRKHLVIGEKDVVTYRLQGASL